MYATVYILIYDALEAVGLGAACEYLSSIGMQRIHDHESELGL